MIILDVKNICHSCPNFEAESIGGEKVYAYDSVVHVSDIYIRCEHQDLCDKIETHLKNVKENNK